MRGIEALPSSATTPKKQQHDHYQYAQDFLRPNPTSESADGPSTTNASGWPSDTYKTAGVPRSVGLGVSRPCSASRLTGAHADSGMNKRELSCAQDSTPGCREGNAVDRPTPTDYGLASKASRLSSQGFGCLTERDVPASFLRRGERAAAAASRCPRVSNPCYKAAVSSSGDRPGIFPVGDSTSPAIAPDKANSLHFCQRFGRGQCSAVDDARRECGGTCRDVAPAAPPTAPATPAGAAEAVSAAAIPEPLGVHRSRAVSRAAVEAWAAAETWASTLAVATDAVASGGRRVDAETDRIAGIRSGVFGGAEAGRQRCEPDVEGLDKGGCRCFLSDNTLDARVGQRVAHWHSRKHHDLSLRGEAARAVGGYHPVGGSAPKFPRDAPSRVASHALFGERRKYNPFGGGKRGPVGTGVSGPMGLKGAAAAVVLWRIDRGEHSWRRRAKRMGLAAFRTHCLQAGRRKQKDAMAKAHRERASKVRGFRGMEALLRRGGGRREAETAVAAADVLTRARWMRRVLVMLRRNWQVCVALRSRDDVADLHFAECRLPDTTRTWREQARVGRSFHNAGILANRERRSKSLGAALTQWASHSLGDRERRRKLLAWRDALSSHHRQVADDFDCTASGVGKEHEDVIRPRDTQVREVLDGGGAQGASELPGRTLSTPLPTKSQLLRRPLSVTAEVTATVLAGRPRELRRATTTACAGRTGLGDDCDAQGHATRDGEKSRIGAGMEHRGVVSAVTDSFSAPSHARQTLVRQTSAGFGDWRPEVRMTTRTTRDARAVGAGEDEFQEDCEGRNNRSNGDAASSAGLGLGGTCDVGRCTVQDGCSSSRAGETMEERRKSKEVAPPLAHESVSVDINETSKSDENRRGQSHISTGPRAVVAMDNAAVVQSGSTGSFKGGRGYGGNDLWRRVQGHVRDIPSVVANTKSVGDLQAAGTVDIVEKKTVAQPTTVSTDAGLRSGIDGERDILGGSVECQRIAEEESLITPPIASGTGACNSMGICRSSMMQMGVLGLPDADDDTVASCEKPEAVDKAFTSPPTGQENSGRVACRLDAKEIVCETGDLFGRCSTLLYEATVVSGGAAATSGAGRGVRPLSHSQVDDMSQGGAPSTVTSVTSPSVSLSRPLSRVASTRQSQARGITSASNASFVNSEPRAECTAGLCARSDGSGSVEPMATGSGGDKHRRCTTNGGVESKKATRAGSGGVLSLSREMALRTESLWNSEEEKKSSRSPHGSELSAEARVVYFCSEGTPSEAETCARSDICYEGTESARGRGEEVEPYSKLCVKDGDGGGMPSAPELAPRDREVRPLTGSSADVHATHSYLRPRSTGKGVENRALAKNKNATPARHTSTEEDKEGTVVPTCAAGRISSSPLPVCQDGQSGISSSVEKTMVGGVLGSLGPTTSYITNFEKNPAEERRSSLLQILPGRRVSTKDVMVETTEITATMPRREQPGDLRSLSTKQDRHSRIEGFQSTSSPPGSSENLGVVLANLGQGFVEKSATRPKVAAPARSILQDELPPQQLPKRAVSSSGDEKGARSNEQGGVLLAYPCSGRALSSELSSISWSDHYEGNTQKQPSSLESTEESTEKEKVHGDCLGLLLKRSTPGKPVSRGVSQTAPAQVDSAMVARQPISLRPSLEEKDELVGTKVAAFLPLTDRHVPASTQQTAIIGKPSTDLDAQLEYHLPHQVEPARSVRSNDAEESQAESSRTDRSIRKRDDSFERQSQQRLTTSEWPDHASTSSHGCADTMVSVDLRLAARSQEEPGSDGMLVGTTRVFSRVPDTIEIAVKEYGIRSCVGDSAEVPAPEVLSSAESVKNFGDFDGSGALLASCDLQTRAGLDGSDTHPRVTGDRQSGRNGAVECGGFQRNRSVGLVTRLKSDRGMGPSMDCEPQVESPSPKLAPPDVVSYSSRGTKDTTYSAKHVQKSSVLIVGRASIGEVGESQISVHDGLQEPPPPRSLSTCSVGGNGDSSRVHEGNIGSGSGDKDIGDGGRKSATTSGRWKRSDKVTLSSRSTASSRSSRRRRDTLEERVSEAFLRRRLQAIGLRFAKRVALTKWRTANATVLAVKEAAKVRRFTLIALLGLGPRLTATMDNTAMAIVTFRRWHRRSAAKVLLRRAFCAWVSQTRLSRSVEAFRCRVLAKHGLYSWRRATQKAGRSRVRSRAIAQFMLRAAGKRRFRAWRQRRRRQADALEVVEEYRAGTGNKPVARRWHRSKRLRARGALRTWMATVRKRPVLRAARLAALSCVDNRRRLSATRAWRALAGDMHRSRCIRRKGDAQYARHLGIQGLRGVRGGTLHARTRRDALGVGDAHWKRRGATLIVETLRDLLDSRTRAFHSAESLRLRAIARAGLDSWRRVVRSRRVAQNALEKANSWQRKRTGKAIFLALTAIVDLRAAQYRAMCIGQRHLRQRQLSAAVTSWRVWTRRQAAGAELYAAAGALHKSWAVSAGLRALDRVARARTARRGASHIAEQYLLRTSGLERWRAAAAARKYAQGQTRVATLHWARNLSAKKVWISWQVATVQQWARCRQEEAAAQHECRRRKKRALRAWAAFAVRSAGARHGRRERGRPLSSAFTSDRSRCCGGGPRDFLDP